ncbi:hypothetical protein [Methylobacterium trifolii]|uniref:Uncharacterized protein n=1 Tax=Methylobacterium trifolii TaxID=1003092 RepID=A0ABQ4TX50_9HYPH|nr:hypothetical protein [Methylobacterium trifolii]GJE58597.1 hypothetical protein MPOCJGCO_0679 [Methylobacterium trifolii]
MLNGAASILYGQLRPGCDINAISKRSLGVPFNKMNYTVGTCGLKEVSGDSAGLVNPDGEWSDRLLRDSGTFVDFTPDDKCYIAPAITWRPSIATSVTLPGNLSGDPDQASAAAAGGRHAARQPAVRPLPRQPVLW